MKIEQDMSKNMDSHFIEKETQMANKCMERWSISVVIRKIQTKSTMRCYLTFLDWQSV